MTRVLLRPSAGWGGLAFLAAAAPFFLSELQLFTAARIVILALWAVSLNLLIGQTGLVSFAHAAFYGVGAYAVALVWLHLGWSPLVGVPLAVLAGGLLALVTGLIALRAVHLYFALLTLALSQLVYVIVFQWYDFTRGDNGIHGIDMPPWLNDPVNAYWFVAAIAALGIAALGVIAASPFGAALLAIRENRRRAQFIGIPVKRYELAAFTIAGAFAGLAGSLFAVFNQEAYPNLLFWTAGATPLFVILIGGMYRFVGPVLGAIAYVLLDNTVSGRTQYSNLIFGAILVAIVLLAPGGITQVAERAAERVRRRAPPPVAGAAPTTAREPELEAQR